MIVLMLYHDTVMMHCVKKELLVPITGRVILFMNGSDDSFISRDVVKS
jgi:hypothetical protein